MEKGAKFDGVNDGFDDKKEGRGGEEAQSSVGVSLSGVEENLDLVKGRGIRSFDERRVGSMLELGVRLNYGNTRKV